MLVLESHDTTAPVATKFVVLVVRFHEGLTEGLEISEVLLVDVSDSQAGSGLHVAEFSKGSLTADKAERNFLLAAESGEMDNGLNGVDIVGNDNQLGLVLLNKSGNVVKTKLDEHGLGAGLGILGLGSSLEALFLVGPGLRSVLSEQLEKLVGLVLVKSRLELGNGWGNLKTLHKNSLLSLDTDVARPLDHTGKIALGLDITSNTEVAGALLEKRVFAVTSGGVTTNNGLFTFNGSLLNLFFQ